MNVDNVNKKHNKQCAKHNHDCRINKRINKRITGFTIVETLCSLLLAALAVLLLGQTMVSALNTDKQSALRFDMMQTMEYYKNQLVSKPFADPQLTAGNYSGQDNDKHFKMKWVITDLSPTLKAVDFSISYKNLGKRSYFYKSGTIKNIF